MVTSSALNPAGSDLCVFYPFCLLGQSRKIIPQVTVTVQQKFGSTDKQADSDSHLPGDLFLWSSLNG
jgi:hypothetical protein